MTLPLFDTPTAPAAVAGPVPPEPPGGAVYQAGGCLWLHCIDGWRDAWRKPEYPQPPRTWASLWEKYGDGLVEVGPTGSEPKPVYAFHVYGQPAPQGSKRGFVNKHTGRVQMAEMSKKVAPWRSDVRDAAAGARAGADPLDGALAADMVFTFRRPKSHYRTGRNAHLLRDAAPSHPINPPDLSKLLRSTEDALTSAGMYVDDARIVRYGRAEKVYVGEDPDALDAPGAVIRIYRIGEHQ